MGTAGKRVLWRGAISFGLIHIPVELHSAATDRALDFDWLDKRTMDLVGYKRINKRTGKEVASNNIVKGIEYKDGQYVVLTPDEIAAAYPKSTHTIEIATFVGADDIPFMYLDRPYYVAPADGDAKVYALLREVLRKTRKVGLARIVIQTRQHLAVLMPYGPALVLDLLRWGDEVRDVDELDLPDAGARAAGLTDKELKMAERLVLDMSSDWNPADFKDSFKEQILKLVEQKARAGRTEAVLPAEALEAAEPAARVYDLTELLQRSLNNLSGGRAAQGKTHEPPPAARHGGPRRKAARG